MAGINYWDLWAGGNHGKSWRYDLVEKATVVQIAQALAKKTLSGATPYIEAPNLRLQPFIDDVFSQQIGCSTRFLSHYKMFYALWPAAEDGDKGAGMAPSDQIILLAAEEIKCNRLYVAAASEITFPKKIKMSGMLAVLQSYQQRIHTKKTIEKLESLVVPDVLAAWNKVAQLQDSSTIIMTTVNTFGELKEGLSIDPKNKSALQDMISVAVKSGNRIYLDIHSKVSDAQSHNLRLKLGLPQADKNEPKWPKKRPVLAKSSYPQSNAA